MTRSGEASPAPAGWVAAPARDFLSGMEACLADGKPANALVILFWSAVSWWIYVPAHELLHAFGCVLGGGEVTRLDISAIYGAALLKRIFPFVSVGSEYAGRLSGFSTNGSDVTYLLTDLMPFTLTVLVGIPLLKSSGSPGLSPLRRSVRFGLAMPLAYAPFISLPGDYYEMGSIVVSRSASLLVPVGPDRWRSDDLFKLAKSLAASGAGPLDVSVVAVSFLAGIAMTYATYGLGISWARLLLKERKR
ncbi:MAG: hypothetical protein M0Z60_15415 [Nitrospiraceae bacterium]|nr:hypothetical protein [Nitrospiraceae bacterium]